MTNKIVALDRINRESIHDADVLRLVDELTNLSQTLADKEAAIRLLTEQKQILERLVSIKVATYTSLLQKIIEELNGSLKDIIFNSKQLFQQVGIVIQPELLNHLDKIFFSAEDLKDFLLEIEPLSHLTVPETSTNGFSLSYLLEVLKRIIPEYFQKDLTIAVEHDCCIVGDFDLLINILRQLLMHAISNVRKLRERMICIGVSDQQQAPVFYIKHKGAGLKNNQILSELPQLKKLIDTLGGKIWVSAKGKKDGYSYSFSFGEKYTVKHPDAQSATKELKDKDDNSLETEEQK